jgi:hypothetical protein
MLTLKQKGLDAPWSSGLRVVGAGGIREKEVHEVLGKCVSSRAAIAYARFIASSSSTPTGKT